MIVSINGIQRAIVVAEVELTRASFAMPGVETFTISPPGLGTPLRISIARPVLPAIGDAAAVRFPVVYSTDADYLFGVVGDTARSGSFGGDMAAAVVVGIGYAQESGDLRFVTTRRFLDFYRGPRRGFDAGAYGKLEFGGAEAFLAALRDHVIPAVEAYVGNIDPERRVLLGTSAGGHFAAYVLSQHPGLFKGYALMSPLLVDPQTPVDGVIPPQRGDGSMVRLIDDLPEDALPAGLKVFLSAGALEEVPGTMFADFSIISNALRLRTALARRGVATEYAQFAGETHNTVINAAISRALRFLLPPDSQPDSQAALRASSDA